MIINQISLVKTLLVFFKRLRKTKMTVKIRPFKGLQNSIKNLTEFLEELGLVYKQKQKVDKPHD